MLSLVYKLNDAGVEKKRKKIVMDIPLGAQELTQGQVSSWGNTYRPQDELEGASQ